jgi:hypothetical protein
VSQLELQDHSIFRLQVLYHEYSHLFTLKSLQYFKIPSQEKPFLITRLLPLLLDYNNGQKEL